MHLPIVNNLVDKVKGSLTHPRTATLRLAGGLRAAMVMMGGPRTLVSQCVVDPLVQKWLD
jgi:hypothetical protein